MSMHMLQWGKMLRSGRTLRSEPLPSQSGYKSQGALSPAAIGGVILVHAGLGAVILTLSAVQVFSPLDRPLWTTNIPKEQAKQPPSPQKAPKAKARPSIAPQTEVALNRPENELSTLPTLTGPGIIGVDNGIGTVVEPVRPPEPPPALLVQAKPDARFASGFQPPYPAAMLRQQMEGAVTVRVTIGMDGRVLDVSLVKTANPAFFEATRRQALSRWRFVPATRDGVAIMSERVMTVHFHLTD